MSRHLPRALYHVLWCGALALCAYISPCVTLSPTDYQSILAELQSPATLHSDPHFLDPEIPVTPNPALSPHPHHHHHYPAPEPPAPGQCPSQSPPLPWSPEAGPFSRESGESSPPRPSELTLSFPVFVLPEPLPRAVRKPHIALNDRLLLSEEEDGGGGFQDTPLDHRPKIFCSPERSDIEMGFSTSSPSLSSMSSMTSSSPEKVKRAEGEGLVGLTFWGSEHERLNRGIENVTKKLEEVVKTRAAEVKQVTLAEEEEDESEPPRRTETLEEALNRQSEAGLQRPSWGTLGEMGAERAGCVGEGARGGKVEAGEECSSTGAADVSAGVTEAQDVLVRQEHPVEIPQQPEEDLTGAEAENETVVGENTEGDGTACEQVYRGEDTQVRDGGSEQVGQSGEGDIQVGYGGMEGDCVGGRPSEADPPLQPWAEALVEHQPVESDSNEEEENGRVDEVVSEDVSEDVSEEALGSLAEEVKGGGSEEEEEEGEEMTEARVQEILRQVEQAEKDLRCSLPGWHSDTSSVRVEPPTPGRSLSSDLLDRHEPSQENSSDSITSSSRGESGRSRHNGDKSQHSPKEGTRDPANGRRTDGTPVTERKAQQAEGTRNGRRKDEKKLNS